jgi:uncharacterized protein YgfB (UPF0149 family)
MLDIPKIPRVSQEMHAISLLLSNDPWLIDFLLSQDRSTLNDSTEALAQLSKGFSRGQQVLVQVALDIWSGEGSALIADVLWCLDSVRFEGFMLAMESLRYGQTV